MVAASKMSTKSEMARMMAEAHRRKLDMCAALEDIADSLPEVVIARAEDWAWLSLAVSCVLHPATFKISKKPMTFHMTASSWTE